MVLYLRCPLRNTCSEEKFGASFFIWQLPIAGKEQVCDNK